MRSLGRRLAHLVLVLLGVTFSCFLLMNLLPGDPATAILGVSATEESRAELRDELGLEDPPPVRYVAWLGDAVTGDLGTSYRNGRPVAEAIGEQLPLTVELMVASQALALLVAAPLAVLGARREGTAADRLATGAAFGLLAIPSFLFAVILVLVFAVQLGWFPATGFVPFGEDPLDHVRSLVLPTLALALPEVAVYTRLLRAELVATLRADFITLARSKGFSDLAVLFRHALRPSLLPLITAVGLTTGRLLGGALIVEEIFALPGLGRLLVTGIFGRDYVVVQGVVLVIAVGYVLVNSATDALYAVVDPRTRHE